MKKLTHSEMLSLPEAAEFAKKDDEKALADYLVRCLYGKKLADFNIGEPFCIEASIATLSVSEDASELSSKVADVKYIVEMFLQTNKVQEQIKNARDNITRLKGPGFMEMAKNAMGAAKRFAKSGFAMVSDGEYARRMEICKPCEQWDATARMGLGKCLKCGCTSTKLRMASEKCPLDKWDIYPNSLDFGGK